MMQNNEDTAGIHHTTEDFDALIQEDEARALNNDGPFRSKSNSHVDVRTIDDPSTHTVDIDNLHFSPETGSQDAINFRGDNMEQSATIDIPETSPLSGNASSRPLSPSIGHPAIGVFGAFAVVAALAVIAMVCRSIYLKRRAKKRLGKEVFKYILDFDVEDVDLTRAVTGGWHGTYKNNLREGIDTDPDTDDDFDEEIYSDDEDDNAFFNASRKIREAHEENMIVFMEEGEDLPLADNNVYLDEEDQDDVYYASGDDLFSAVESSHSRSY